MRNWLRSSKVGRSFNGEDPNTFVSRYLVWGVLNVRDCDLRTHEDLQVHRHTGSLHRVRCAHVPRKMSGKLKFQFLRKLRTILDETRRCRAIGGREHWAGVTLFGGEEEAQATSLPSSLNNSWARRTRRKMRMITRMWIERPSLLETSPNLSISSNQSKSLLMRRRRELSWMRLPQVSPTIIFYVKGEIVRILHCNLRSFGGRSRLLFLLNDLHIGGGGHHHPPHHLRALHQPALRQGEEARQRRTRECQGRCAHSQVLFCPRFFFFILASRFYPATLIFFIPDQAGQSDLNTSTRHKRESHDKSTLIFWSNTKNLEGINTWTLIRSDLDSWKRGVFLFAKRFKLFYSLWDLYASAGVIDCASISELTLLFIVS